MAAARRVSPLVTRASHSHEAFAARLLAVVQESGDIASEACWQQLSRLIAQDWPVFAADQSPLETWGMLTKCTEEVLKIRRVAQRDKGQSGADALEEFRGFMGEVLGRDTEE